MRIAGLLLVYLFPVCLAVVGPAAEGAAGETEQAAATHTPWSGYWWPIAKGELLVPLSKYDYLTSSQATPWEQQNHPPGPDVPEWHGYCHAWAAASVLEYEPGRARQATGRAGDRQLVLGVGDQKGLFAASHTRDVANTYGDRFGDGLGSEDPHDIAPDALWQLLKTYIHDQQVAIVMDLESGPEVWNYPVYAYRVDYAPYGPAGQYSGQLSLWAADDAVPPDHVGTLVHYETYSFTFQMANGSLVMGSGRWVGQSIANHPDFAWYPYVVVPENPYISYDEVKRLVGAQGSVAPPGASPPGTSPGLGGTLPVVPGSSSPAAPGEMPPSGTVVPGAGPGAGSAVGGLAVQPGIPLSPLQVAAAIAERTSAFALDVTVDRFDGGHYAVGEPLSLRGSSQKAGFLYLFAIDPLGKLSLLFPGPGDDNRIAAGQPFSLPSPRSPSPILVEGPFGVHRIKAIVADQPLLMGGAAWQEQSAHAKALFGRRACRFRWPPTPTRQVQTMLHTYQQNGSIPPAQFDGIEIRRILVAFAQDEVAFYVGPAEGEPTPEVRR